ncbi:MAG: hypothetical protein ACT4QC_22820 [Planctomycetaceae bacterium]
MTNKQLMLTSLVGAIPGLFLALLMMWAFVGYAGGWSFAVKGLALLMLLAGGALAAMPVGIFLSARPKPAATGEPKAKAGPGDTQASPVMESSEAVAVASGDSSFEMADVGHDSEEFAAAGESALEAGSDDFELGDEFQLDSHDDGPKKA